LIERGRARSRFGAMGPRAGGGPIQLGDDFGKFILVTRHAISMTLQNRHASLRYAEKVAADKQFVCARSYAALHPHVSTFLQSASAQETLLIAPSRGAADDLARQCCSAGVMGLHRMTLNQLAAELATPAMADEAKAPASRLAMQAICARVA